MRLKYGELESLMKEEKILKDLKKEVKRVFGPAVDTDVRLSELAESVNYELDVARHLGRLDTVTFDQAVIKRFATHKNPAVRKMAARLVNEGTVKAFMHDSNRDVRLAAAERLPLADVGKMVKRFPLDEQLTYIFSTRKRLVEAGMPDPDVVDDPMDTYGNTPLGDPVKTPAAADDFGDQWYKETAHELLRKYGKNIEFNWEEKAVKSLCDHTYATSGVEIDRDKLLSAVFDVIEEEEESRISKSTLEEAANNLRAQAIYETMQQPVFAIDEGNDDDVMVHLEGLRVSDHEFVRIVKETLNVRESRVTRSLRKFVFQEGLNADMPIPMKARLPHGFGLRAVDENVLDRFVESWNKVQALSGEPVLLEWSPDPSDIQSICFSAMLK